jgi:tetratricopeptide (TPR) repeat protein
VGREGDATRRASVRLCLLGLEADEAGRASLAESHYERAIQIDPTNPFAYLALARHALDVDEPVRALEYLNQAEVLLESQAARSPRVEPHLAGLRGAALRMDGRGGDDLLDDAARLSPSVWSDGQLSAAELR